MCREEREEIARLYDDDSPGTLGDWGELITASTLRDKLGIRVLRTLYIGTSQIDMVAISPHGLFVIENKNYHGVVAGHVESKYWDVWYRPGGRIYKLYNPVFQNRKHGDDVRNMLYLMGYSEIPVYCPVIFNDFSILRVADSSPRSTVCKLSDFVSRYEGADLEPVVLEPVCSHLSDLFMKFQDRSEEARLSHLASIAMRRKS